MKYVSKSMALKSFAQSVTHEELLRNGSEGQQA